MPVDAKKILNTPEESIYDTFKQAMKDKYKKKVKDLSSEILEKTIAGDKNWLDRVLGNI